MNTRTSKLWRIGVVAGVALLGALAVAAGMGTLAAAAPEDPPIYVRTDGDDANCDGYLDIAYPGGGPTSCAAQTIQGGIVKVATGGTIVVRAGTYSGGISIGKDVTLQGAGAGSTVIDAGGSGRGFGVGSSITVTISGVTVRNGRNIAGAGIFVNSGSVFTLTDSTVYDNSGGSNHGGGLYMLDATAVISGCSFISNTVGSSQEGGGVINTSGALVVVNSTFAGNDAGSGSANSRGGAIRSGGSGSSLTVIDSTFIGNRSGYDGGGVSFAGNTTEPLVVTGSVFTDNTVSGADYTYGGALYTLNGTVTISNTTIASNATTYAGGGIALMNGTARVYGSIIASNVCTGSNPTFGGGVYNNNCPLTIEESVIRDNWITGGSSLGGGLRSDGPTTLDRVTVSGNASRDYRSGGIHSQDPLTLTNVTVSGNEAMYLAGGLMQTGGATATIVNCTIASNTITSGGNAGGMYVWSTVNMTNSLLAYNGSSNCIAGSGGVINSYGHNLEDDDTCDLGVTGDITDTDPLLLPLADNGGPSAGAAAAQEPMRTHALVTGSPAIDGGDDGACPATDQRGVGRPIDGDGDGSATCDVGAYEAPGRVYLPLVLRSW